MSRVIGFSLKLEGTQSTLADIKKVEAALGGVGNQINSLKKVDTGVLKPLFSAEKEFKGILADVNKTLKDQQDILSKIGATKGSDTSVVDNLKKQIKELQSQVKILKNELGDLKNPTIQAPDPNGLNSYGEKVKELIEKYKSLGPIVEQVSSESSQNLINSIAAIEVRLKAVQDNIRTARNTGDTAQLAKLLTESETLKRAKKELTDQAKLEAKEFEAVSKAADPTSLVGLREELKRLKEEYILLSEEERNSVKGFELFNKIVSTNTSISNIEQSVGDFRRNVGNYTDIAAGIIPMFERIKATGALANTSILETFNNESKQRVENLRQEVHSLAVEFDKLSIEEKKTSAGSEIFAKLTAKARELDNAVSAGKKNVNGIKTAFIGLGDLITGGLLTGGIVAAFGALKEFGAGSIEEFKQAEVAISKVRAQLEATGNASGKTAEELRKIAQDIEVTTGIDGDKILDQVTSKLLTFTRIQGDAFDRAQKAAVDLGQTLGGDLSSAAQVLGKALDNPLKGITLLAKSGVGVALSDSQKTQVKNAIAANDIYKAQGIILTAVEARVKGVASAINNSELSGLRRWTVDWNNFKESFGKAIVSVANEFFGFVKRFNDKTLFVPVGARETQAALKDLTESITTETAAIENSFSALKEDNLNRDVKKKIIEDLVQKYPELLNKYELEAANLSELDLIQKNLTTTVKQQVFERVKAAAQEATATEIAQKKIQLAYAKRQDASGLSFLTRATIALGTGDIKKGFERYAQTLNEQIKNLESEFKNQEQVLNDAFPEINQDKVLKNYQGAALKIKGTLAEIEEALKNPAISDNAKRQILEFQKEFLNFNINPNSSQNIIDLIYKRGAEVDKKIKEFSKKSIDVIKSGDDGVQKNIDEQKKRIEELKKKIAELNADGIANEFDKQIEQVKQKTEADFNELQDKISKLKAKPLVTSKDAEEIKLSNQLIDSLVDAEVRQIDRINENRSKALQEAKNELIKLQAEVQNIILEGSRNVTESNIDTSSFKFAQINREIEIKYNVDNTSLKEQLAKGEISEKEFKKRSVQNEKDKLNDQLKAAQDYSNEVNALYQAQYLAQLKILEAKKVQADKDAEIEASLKRQKLVEDSLAGKVDDKTATKELLVIDNELAAKKNKNLQDYNIAVTNANQELVTNQQQTSDKITGITQQQTDTQIKQAEDAAERKKALIKEVINLAVDTARSIADAVFEIENNQIQDTHDRRIENLEKEKEARLKLVKGNAAEEERINREFEAKKKTVDRAAAREKQDVAIKQAIINGALAGISAIANTSLPFPLSLLALIPVAAAVAAQIAVIRSQSFAEGGFTKRVGHGYTGASQAPPDSSGKRPVGTATIHENEYFAPAEQVSDNKPLFDELEKDRMSRKRGFGKTFKADSLNNLALKAVEAAEKSKLGKVVKFSPPVLYQYTHFIKSSGNNQVEISEAYMDTMADKIAAATSHAVNKGIEDGYHKAVTKLQKHQERLNIARERTQL